MALSSHRVRFSKEQALAAAALAFAVSADRSLSGPESQQRWAVMQEALIRAGRKVVQVWAEHLVCFTLEEGVALVTVIERVRVECPDAEQAARFRKLIAVVATLLRFTGCKPMEADARLPELVAKVGAPSSTLKRRR